ncbi:MAG: alpha/beta fold hydrolase [Opitutaceae bacterium]|nr:alpha/beta fold hydrolase [Opitutaceae bacterium]
MSVPKTRTARVGVAVLLAAAMLVAGGCASAMLAPRIVTAPNAAGAQRPALADANPEARVALAQLYGRTLRVPVAGSPPVEIACGVIEPGDYQHQYEFIEQTVDPKQPRYSVRTWWQPLAANAPRLEPKGTIVLLHGIWMSRESVLHWAIHLAQAGYRTVPVDLRGHGTSTGAWVTYGALETGDLAAVLDELQRLGMAGDRVGVLGISYGASVGLLWASRDPRVGAVVALEPFSDPREAIRHYARAMLSPEINRKLSDQALAGAASKAARLAGFRWEQADVIGAMKRLTVPVLFIHGEADTVIPPEHSRRLCEIAPKGARLIVMSADDHFSLPMRLDGLTEDVVRWFDRGLGDTPASVLSP